VSDGAVAAHDWLHVNEFTTANGSRARIRTELCILASVATR